MISIGPNVRNWLRPFLAAIAAATLVVGAAAPAAASLPEIRTSAQNRVPACVTPDRLMAFLRTRNSNLAPKFQDIATWYKRHGEALRVRWDYAFFQMVLETNYLMFRRGDGSPGDVSITQNNFAGIGATGGGVPGDRFKDVPTGVLAQMQHLVVYSGERVESPVAPRTQFAQDDILSASLALRRPVTFTDLRNRWAADRNYARSMETVAGRFSDDFCRTPPPAPSPVVAPVRRVVEPVATVAAVAPATTATPAAAKPAASVAMIVPPAPQPAARPTRKVARAMRGSW